jgi:molybdate transport system regulatory protein
MGPGKAELLEMIIETGSISAAAKRMRMSYRRAWELVDTMNRCFTEPLVITSAGGSHGGGAAVTEFGRAILDAYQAIVVKTNEIASSEINAITNHLRQP